MDLDGRKVTVLAKYAKNGEERDVALGDVALDILNKVRLDNPDPEGHVFLGNSGAPLKTIQTGFVAASLDDVRAALNRAARPIDGEPPAGAILFPIPSARGTAHQTAQSAQTRAAEV